MKNIDNHVMGVNFVPSTLKPDEYSLALVPFVGNPWIGKVDIRYGKWCCQTKDYRLYIGVPNGDETRIPNKTTNKMFVEGITVRVNSKL